MKKVLFVCTGNSARTGVARLHWPLDDPAGATGSAEEVRAVFRRSRDAIERLVREFLAGLK